MRFTPEVIEEAVLRLGQAAATYQADHPDECDARIDPAPRYESMSIRTGMTQWTFSTSDEFYAELRSPFDQASCWIRSRLANAIAPDASVTVTVDGAMSQVTVVFPDRAKVERIIAPFERDADKCKIPMPVMPPPPPAPRPTVFIGHGRSALWRDLKDHLHDLQGYDVEAYESGARTGRTISDVLNSMLSVSGMAVIVMTAEDEQADGTMRARQNVVHEAGLFQGRIGFAKTLILLEDGVEPFSNVDGIQYLPFNRGRIQETYGHVLAALSREYPGRNA
ncbi:nucleotide-binding protein [Cellulomonas sp.]|uniref:nucleotide-binding protein n=1 Tax=Cellulomonas sp. TaxID=40001 RepID=UPI0025C3B152|nr:nucleotide-binding protein [Cellulomonas sp.]